MNLNLINEITTIPTAIGNRDMSMKLLEVEKELETVNNAIIAIKAATIPSKK